MALKTIQVDGIPLEVTDAGAVVIDTLQKRIADASAANLKLVSDHGVALKAKDDEIARLTGVVSDKDKELGTKDAEIIRLKADEAKLDKLVEDRAAVLSLVAAVAPTVDCKGKTLGDIRRAVVAHASNVAVDALKDKSDDYVCALFDKLAEGVQQDGVGGGSAPDTFRDAMRTVPGAPAGGVAATHAAHHAMVTHLQDAWKAPIGNKAA